MSKRKHEKSQSRRKNLWSWKMKTRIAWRRRRRLPPTYTVSLSNRYEALGLETKECLDTKQSPGCSKQRIILKLVPPKKGKSLSNWGFLARRHWGLRLLPDNLSRESCHLLGTCVRDVKKTLPRWLLSACCHSSRTRGGCNEENTEY